ncbi:MAG: tRNA (guanosine(46)-N7)-methyltransferase TrmB [Ignavibacteria bacterium]|nr:tRNA (guanosine(46)-N7)-methyltransferase TrmB [Ignavibacteria bacterium]
MARKKHRKQFEVRTLPNVFHTKQEDISHKLIEWFGSAGTYTLELGCGNGEYTIDLARKYPDKRFIGVDRAGARIWNSSKSALNQDVKNAAFFLTYVERLSLIFNEPCIDEIYIPFPNPLPRRRHMKAMLVHPRFLALYKKYLVPGGKIHLKTDDDILYEFALQVVRENNLILHVATENTYLSEGLPEPVLLQTRFEKFHLSQGRTIKYVCFSFPPEEKTQDN